MIGNISTIVWGQFTATLANWYRPSQLQGDGQREYCCIEPDNTDVADGYWSEHDPDAGLRVRSSFATGLREQADRLAAGDHGRPLEDILKDLGLT